MANGLILKELIEHLGTNVSQFERSIDVGSTTISKAIARNSEIKLDIVQKILDKFPQVNKEWLLKGQPPMINEPDAPQEPGNSYAGSGIPGFNSEITENFTLNQSLNDEEIMRKTPLELIAMAVYNSSVAHLKDSENLSRVLTMLENDKKNPEGATKKELAGTL